MGWWVGNLEVQAAMVSIWCFNCCLNLKFHAQFGEPDVHWPFGCHGVCWCFHCQCWNSRSSSWDHRIYILLSPSCKETWTGFSMKAFKGLWSYLKLTLASAVMLCLEIWYNQGIVLI
ncbi:protein DETOXIFICATION 35-like [Macadamia integrifolia]|uniref:protein DETOXIFICATION 35-like n=1 Tax=Macadamia integrifolia TaxID=60698 RepID=UPI001C52FDAC|nr:protein DETOXIFICATION 35-like [Macadamia integrifolia]